MTVALSAVTLLFTTHIDYLDHLTGPHHPERPERLQAVLDGAAHASVADALVPLEPREATRHELELVHPGFHLDLLQRRCAAGAHLDPDTSASPGTWRAALLSAGAGLAAIDALEAGVAGASAAFCAVRPPGHHATPTQAMGFCILSNVAVAAASLAARGERVLVVDFDAHHGNGTQDVFYADPRVMFVSLHQWPLYPGTGSVDETGDAEGLGTTLNLPMPAGTTGDAYLAAIDEVIAPVVARFAPTWLIVSAGYDGHRADPITELGLSAGDYALITRRLLDFAPAGRRLVMLEGGYDLDALAHSAAATMAALVEREHLPERPTANGPGRRTVEAVRAFWYEHGLL
jgi:acetoin utilization deacetylase AcuC-like enzyme